MSDIKAVSLPGHYHTLLQLPVFRNYRPLWLTGLLFIYIFIFKAAFQYWWPAAQASSDVVSYDAECDLHEAPCQAKLFNGGSLKFSIEPRTIPVSKPLQLKVEVTGFDVDAITIDINGSEMKMPPNRVSLHKSDKQKFIGKGGLSFCSRGEMRWVAMLELQSGQKNLRVPFHFVTGGH